MPETVRFTDFAGVPTVPDGEGGRDVAAAVLCQVENEFVTGVCLPVDGGPHY